MTSVPDASRCRPPGDSPSWRFGFARGATAGALVAIVLSLPFVLGMVPVAYSMGIFDPAQALSPVHVLVFAAVVAAPSSVVAAVVGGLIGSAQLHETLEPEPSPSSPFRPALESAPPEESR